MKVQDEELIVGNFAAEGIVSERKDLLVYALKRLLVPKAVLVDKMCKYQLNVNTPSPWTHTFVRLLAILPEGSSRH